jgi:hypothetical protein
MKIAAEHTPIRDTRGRHGRVCQELAGYQPNYLRLAAMLDFTPRTALSNIDERGIDPALNYLFGRRKQEQSSQ